jgi:hypothetical protein
MPPRKTYDAELHTPVEPQFKARLVNIAQAEEVPLAQVVRRLLKAGLTNRDPAVKGEPA